MNIQKKQLKIPSWLPTTVGVLAIVTIILLIYVVVTTINPIKNNRDITPSPVVSQSPVPSSSPEEAIIKAPLTSEDSQSALFSAVSTYLTEKNTGFSPDSLTVKKKATLKEGTTLIYAKYKCNDQYTVSELIYSDSLTEASAASDELSQFSKKSRFVSDVAALYIEALVANFYDLRNKGNVAAITSLLSSKSEKDAEAIVGRMEYIDSINLSSLSINAVESDTVAYVLFATEEVHLTTIATAAPGLSEILIRLDSDGYPLIFIGETDEKTDAARTALKSSSAFTNLKASINAKLQEALDSDPSLKAAYENMLK